MPVPREVEGATPRTLRTAAGARADRDPRRDRQKENAGAPEDTDGKQAVFEFVERGGRLIKRIRKGGCWYRTLDTDAGIRAYTGERGAKRSWHGYYNQKAIDHFTGGVLFAGVYNASVQEYNQFPDLFEKLSHILGRAPETIIADKGQSIDRVFELCTTNGTAAIIPWRPWGSEKDRTDYETHDRHGIPRCKHCGGPTTFRRFAECPAPRIWFSCLVKATPECEREQSIHCKTDWRLLLPLWRTDPLYQELRHSLGSFEAQHDYWRDPYRVGADSLGNRPKAIGIGWHQLRALLACLIEWLPICHREGWLGSARRNQRHPRRHALLVGIDNARSLRRSRICTGLMTAYGKRAADLHLGDAILPSRRDPPDSS